MIFFLFEPLWVEPFRIYYERGEVWACVLLNMHSEHHQPDDIFHRLVRLAAERKTQVIDPPETAMAAFDKARLHSRLVEAQFNVPFTILVPREKMESFAVSESEAA